MSSLNPLQRVVRQVGEVLEVSTAGLRSRRPRAVLDPSARSASTTRRRGRVYPHQFSGGMRQRVMIAMALATSPTADCRRADHGARRDGAGADPRAVDLLCRDRHGGAADHARPRGGGASSRSCGGDVRGGSSRLAPRELFADPQHEYTPPVAGSSAWHGQRQGCVRTPPQPTTPTRENLLELLAGPSDFRQEVPHSVSTHPRPVRGRRQRRPGHPRADQTVDDCRRIRLRQIHDRPSRPAPLREERQRRPVHYLGSISGYDSKDMRPLRRDVQTVFQDPYGSLSPRLSVGHTIEEGLAIQNPWLKRESATKAYRTAQPRSPSSPRPRPLPARARAVSANASRSPAPSRSSRILILDEATRRSMCRCRRRSSTSCSSCRADTGSRTCSSATT